MKSRRVVVLQNGGIGGRDLRGCTIVCRAGCLGYPENAVLFQQPCLRLGQSGLVISVLMLSQGNTERIAVSSGGLLNCKRFSSCAASCVRTDWIRLLKNCNSTSGAFIKSRLKTQDSSYQDPDNHIEDSQIRMARDYFTD